MLLKLQKVAQTTIPSEVYLARKTSVIPLDDHGKEVWEVPNCDWVLRTRTSSWASSFDKEFHNQTVRTVRKEFGGRFYNDHFGNNRYIVVEKEHSTAESRGLFAVRERLEGELRHLENALPEEQINVLTSTRLVDINDV